MGKEIEKQKSPEGPNASRMAELKGDRRRSRTNSVGSMGMSAPSAVTGLPPDPDDIDTENDAIANNFDETYTTSISENRDKIFTTSTTTTTTTTTDDGITTNTNAHTKRSSTMKRAELDFTICR